MNKYNLTVGSLADNGEKIIALITDKQNCVVYITKSGKPGFECEPDLINRKINTIQKHDELVRLIKNHIKKEEVKKTLYLEQGYILSNSLHKINYDDPNAFKKLENKVNIYIKEKLLIRYLLGATIIGGLSLLIFPFEHKFEPWFSEHFTCGILGILGAYISIFSRVKNLIFNTLHSSEHYIILGVIRISIGFFFGLLTNWLVQGNLIFPMAKENKMLLYCLCAIAGYNERVVPDYFTNKNV